MILIVYTILNHVVIGQVRAKMARLCALNLSSSAPKWLGLFKVFFCLFDYFSNAYLIVFINGCSVGSRLRNL
jgi:hypothetical protein